MVSRQNGKGDLGHATPILTDQGWKLHGDLQPGDFVYGSDGKLTEIVAVSEEYTDSECYRVTFTDESSVIAGSGHLWEVRNKKNSHTEVRATESLRTSVGGRRPDNGRMEYNWRVRCDAQVAPPAADLPIDPYLLGYWLGDGTSGSSEITVGHADEPWVADRLVAAGCTIVNRKTHDHGMARNLRFRIDAKMRDGFESRCRRLGVWGNKHIPDIYLTASIEQRKQLLAGLLDSDGSARMNTRSTQVEFCTTIPRLAEGFQVLIRSLGIRASKRVGKAGYRDSSGTYVPCKDRYRFLWTPTFNPFQMPRKANLYMEPISGRQAEMSITSIERVATVPTRCIQVSNSDGIYLVGKSFIPTHNSILEALTLAGLFLFEEELIIHCLAVDTPVLTRDSGWKRIDSLTSEDYVFHPSGEAIRVLGKSPVWMNQNCYRVRTTDGREVIADADHLWTVCDRRYPRSVGPRGSARHIFEMKTMTTKEMFEAGVERYPNRANTGMRFTLPRQHPVNLPERTLPVDPYVLGAWLGDGGSHNATLISHVDDIPHWREEFARCGTPTSQHADPNHVGLLGGFWRFINDAGLVGNKHIPEDYLLGSPRQREALLQGLMDADGTAHGGRASFSNTNKNLVDGVAFLARSLGWRVGIDVSDPAKRKSGYASLKPQYRVKWMPKLGDGYVPFRMLRKVSQLNPVGRVDGRKDGRFTVSIASIEPVESTPVSCIRVDAEDGLFLAGESLLVTHNSAHLMDTSKNAKARLELLLGQSGEKFRPKNTNGFEALELTAGPNKGAMVMFRTRTGKGGLGMSADRVIFDEAMDVDRGAIQALVPTLSSRKNPQLWFTGSAVDQRLPAHAHCQVFGGLRQSAIDNLATGRHSKSCYIEWSISDPEPPEIVDPVKIAEANPALGYRLTMDKVNAEFQVFAPTEDWRGFAVQRYGWGDWPTFGAARSEIALDHWRTLRNQHPQYTGEPALALYRAPEGGPWAIAAARRTMEGPIDLEIGYAGSDAPAEVMDRFVAAATSLGPVEIVVGRGGATEVLPELEAAGFAATVPNLTDEARACGGFLNDATLDKDQLAISHGDQPSLNGAVSHAVKKSVSSGGFVWDRINEATYATLMAATLARWALLKSAANPEPEPRGFDWPDEDEINEWLNEDIEDWLNTEDDDD